jgi:hypothetical protein
MTQHEHLDDTILTDEAFEQDVQLLAAAGQVATAWRAGDLMSTRRWALCLGLQLMDHAEEAGFAIWDPRHAVTAQRRAGHDAWTAAQQIVRGEPKDDGRRVDELLPLVARFLTDSALAAA